MKQKIIVLLYALLSCLSLFTGLVLDFFDVEDELSKFLLLTPVLIFVLLAMIVLLHTLYKDIRTSS